LRVCAFEENPGFGEISLRCDFRDLAVSIGLNGDFKGLTGYSSIQPQLVESSSSYCLPAYYASHSRKIGDLVQCSSSPGCCRSGTGQSTETRDDSIQGLWNERPEHPRNHPNSLLPLNSSNLGPEAIPPVFV
jgi:hypothetical protein